MRVLRIKEIEIRHLFHRLNEEVFDKIENFIKNKKTFDPSEMMEDINFIKNQYPILLESDYCDKEVIDDIQHLENRQNAILRKFEDLEYRIRHKL